MRFRSAVAVAAALASAAATSYAQTRPEMVRDAIASRLKQQLPDVPVATYVLGSAALDAALRAALQGEATGAGGTEALAEGRKLWTRKFKDGKSLAGCFPNGGRRIAQNYPQYDARLKRVVTLEIAINQCLKAHREAAYEPGDPATMGAALAYVRSLSEGQKVAVRVPAAAGGRFEDGRRLYFSRLGQRNFACASCHLQNAGRYYGEAALSPAIGQATHWPVLRSGALVTLQGRMRECLELMGAAPFPFGSDELNALEYFLAYLSNGLAIQPLALRR